MFNQFLYGVGNAIEGNLWERLGDFFTLKYEFLMWCALGSALVGLCSGVLGVFLVLRRMSLVGDVLSHAMLPGLVAGFMLVERKGAIGVMYGGDVVGVDGGAGVGVGAAGGGERARMRRWGWYYRVFLV